MVTCQRYVAYEDAGGGMNRASLAGTDDPVGKA